ncbi:MAG: HYR domain-containing protein [Thermoanaerobaculia bacterium]
MRSAIAAALLFFAIHLYAAGTITDISPTTFRAFTNNQTITVYGDGLGDVLVFDGPPGPLETGIIARDARSVTGQLPGHVINTPGSYTIVVRGADGDTNPARFDVIEHQGLVLLVPDPVVVTATSREGAIVEFEVIPWGGQDPNPTVTCDPPSGSLFPIGPSTVQCVARNSYGETAHGEVSIYVQDGSAPVLTLPDDIVVKAESEDGTVVTFEATAHDDVDGDLPVTCTPPSGSRFPIGITTVQCSATDSHLNPAEGSFTVEVTDENHQGMLVIQVPESLTLEADSSAGAQFYFQVTAYGSDDPEPAISCDPASGSVFPIGTTKVLCIATDRFGGRAEGEFSITVVDTFGPELLLGDIAVEGTGSAGAEVTFATTAFDRVDGEVPLDCTPKSGSLFPYGSTRVQCSAKDSRGNVSEASFTVTVGDFTPPVLQLSDITADATSPDGAEVTFTPVAIDAVDGSVEVTCTPTSGSLFPIGSTTVQCSASDSHGNTAEGSFAVIVNDGADTVAPHISSVTATPNVLEPANHKLVTVTVTVDAVDAVDPMPRCTVVDVTANEPIIGAGSGNTDFDWRITGELEVELRAERSGQGTDRIYKVYVSCVDAAGNEAAGSVSVTVPKSTGSGDQQAITAKPTGRRRAVGKP